MSMVKARMSGDDDETHALDSGKVVARLTY